MAQICDLHPDAIDAYVMLTGSDESEARYMLDLYNGDLTFAVCQHHDGFAPTPEDILSGVAHEVEQGAIDYLEAFNDDLGCGDHRVFRTDNECFEIAPKSVDLPYSETSDAEVYLKSFKGDVESACNMLLKEENTNLETEKYLSAFNGNSLLAMHTLLEAKNKDKINKSKLDDGFDVFEAARKYLDYLQGDLERAVNMLVEIDNPEGCNLNTEFTREASRLAETYLDSVAGDFELAFNILLEVHQPETSSDDYLNDLDETVDTILDVDDYGNNVNNADKNQMVCQRSISNEGEFAAEFLASFNGDTEKAMNMLLEVCYEKYYADFNDLAINDEHTCARMYLQSFSGNCDHAIGTLLDASYPDEKPGDGEAKSTDFTELQPGVDERFYQYNRIQHHCPCGNKDPINYKHYFYHDTHNKETEFIGIFCMRCDHEYLIADVLNTNNTANKDGDVNSHLEFKLFNCRLYQNRKEKPKDDSKLNPGMLKSVDDISVLKRGDHFALDRQLYTHHGIVYDVDSVDKTFEGVHYQKDKSRATIIRETINFDNERKLYRIDYDESKKSADHTKLVIARACSRIGDTGYHLLYDNCEHFANFCKTGILESLQTDACLGWIKQKIDQLLTEKKMKAAYRFVYPKGKEALIKSKNVEAGIMIMVEGKNMIMEIRSLQSERNEGNISLKECVEKCFSRIVSGLIDVGIRVGVRQCDGNLGACIGRLISPNGRFKTERMGIFIGSIIEGQVGHLAEHTLGNIIGNYLGSVLIPKLIPYDDIAINDIKDLQVGDHVVFHAGLHHPRCHGIVTDHNSISHVKLVRNSYSQGVVEEEMKFNDPLYKVIYKDGESREVDETISRARSKLHTNEYNLITFNCKHFAQWCKKR